MKFISTVGKAAPADLRSALLAGLAPDGGLYFPDPMPRFRVQDFDGRTTLSEVAEKLLTPFFEDDPLLAALKEICASSLDLETPIVSLGEDSFLLELFHGPTAAFKDYGARFLANTLGRIRNDATAEAPLTILVATSGDTGSAVASAFHLKPGFRVVILYPESGVSRRQAHQLGCFGDNITALHVPSGFDACQAMVKAAFADRDLRARVPLSSANSISLGRLLPQTTYYAQAALRHHRSTGRSLSFIVPTGNLGNAVAALMAKAMGLPIARVLFATNRNLTLPDFLSTGRYHARASVSTLANAMDVGDPSNVARLRFMMAQDPGLEESLDALSVSDEAIRARIREGETKYGRVFCPHTACAIEMLEHERRAGAADVFCAVATAHPAKFEDVVEPLIGHPVPLPPTLQAMLERPSRSEPLEARDESLKALLRRL